MITWRDGIPCSHPGIVLQVQGPLALDVAAQVYLSAEMRRQSFQIVDAIDAVLDKLHRVLSLIATDSRCKDGKL